MNRPALAPQTPERFLEAAREYRRAVEILVRNPLETPLEALGLVAAHCTEISLKAALLASGVPEGELRRRAIRHDLSALWALAVRHGVPLDEEVPFWCALLGIAHNEPYLFRYAREGWGVGVPNRRDLEEGLDSLLEIVSERVERRVA